MNLEPFFRTKSHYWAGLSVAVGLLVAGCCPAEPPSAKTTSPGPACSSTSGFVGSSSCRECHEKFYALWSTSHHGLAMQPYTAAFAAEQLTPQAEDVAVGNRTYRAAIGPNEGFLRETGPDGTQNFAIQHVLGGKNVYFFLTPLERGRLQVLPLAYDVHQKVWYDMAASGVRHFPDRTDAALDWRDRMFTFNVACFNCHVSNLSTNYDFDTDAYHTTWSEPGIDCEMCHGPSGEHVAAMRALPKGETPGDLKIIRTKTFNTQQTNDLCASCHAKMIPLSAAFRPGDKFFDHFDLIVLDHADFYPDGRDLGENYTHATWLQSPCVQSGKLDCNHCHTSSGRMRFERDKMDQACLPCHEDVVANAVAHGHHPAGSRGNDCVGCHMPMTRFAAMNRTDHSMRPPTPEATLVFQSPNACNGCHADRDAAWANAWCAKWYKAGYQDKTMRHARHIDAARKRDWKDLAAMLEELGNGEGDEVYRASLVRLLAACDDERQWPVLMRLLEDPAPLVRSSAATTLGRRLTPEVIEKLLQATGDDSRLVRIRAAAALASVSGDSATAPRDRSNLARAAAEFQTAMHARPDDWASLSELGSYHMASGKLAAAVACFQQATRLEPRQIGPLVNAGIAYSSLGDVKNAEKSLRQAIARDAKNGAVWFNLGLLLGEQQRFGEAEQALRAALEADPQLAAAAYNLGVLVGQKNGDEAVALCEKAHALQPNDPKYAHTLAFYLWRKGDLKKAAGVLQETIDRWPLYWDAYALLAEVYQQQGEPAILAELYRKALSKPELPAGLRQEMESRLNRIEATKP